MNAYGKPIQKEMIERLPVSVWDLDKAEKKKVLP